MWPLFITASSAQSESAASGARTASPLGAILSAMKSRLAGKSGPVPNIKPKLKRAGYDTYEALVSARGMRLHNRDPKGAGIFRDTNLSLFRGR